MRIQKLPLSYGRMLLITKYRWVACGQFIVGFLLLFFAIYCANFHVDGYADGTAPYFIGGIIGGVTMLELSFFAGAVYYQAMNSGQKVQRLVIQIVKPMIKIHMVSSILVLPISAVGMIFTIMWGLCSKSCSYVGNNDMNYGMAAFLLTLEAVGVVLTLCSLVLCLCSCKQFGIELPEISIPRTSPSIEDNCSEIDLSNETCAPPTAGGKGQPSETKDRNHAIGNGDIPSSTKC
ncbi:uncharacterized protein LOC128243831 isoform X2 [Mya arenaria]|uniref:uncharacterized protein LOC128243831 isoform X2 n=1 Tax=Mya arenaria TaxID=6604 RepID=UPI0022E3F430|nr:uncharacterized protein LOC128243831 isoform X2 [Mya arenaria]